MYVGGCDLSDGTAVKATGAILYGTSPVSSGRDHGTDDAIKLEPKRMRLVYPYVDREPNMVLIEGLLGGNSRITVEKPLIVYEKPGVYTQEIREIYGDGR